MSSRRMVVGRAFPAMLLATAMAGCVSSPRPTPGADNQVDVVPALAVPDASEIAAALASRGYVLGPLDKISISVIGYPELEQKMVQIDSGGRIQLALIGSLMAAGKSPAQLSAEIDAAYRRTYIRKPQAVISIDEIRSQLVTVEGAVNKPGVYPAVGPLRLNTALALAEGTSEYAKFSNVAVFRTIHGKRYAAVFNLNDIRKGRYDDPEIYPNDVIIVGESSVRRVFKDIVSIAPFVAVFRPFG